MLQKVILRKRQQMSQSKTPVKNLPKRKRKTLKLHLVHILIQRIRIKRTWIKDLSLNQIKKWPNRKLELGSLRLLTCPKEELEKRKPNKREKPKNKKRFKRNQRRRPKRKKVQPKL